MPSSACCLQYNAALLPTKPPRLPAAALMATLSAPHINHTVLGMLRAVQRRPAPLQTKSRFFAAALVVVDERYALRNRPKNCPQQ